MIGLTVAFTLLSLYDTAVNSPIARQKQVELESEFTRVRAYAEASEIEHHAYSKVGLALVGSTYRSSAQFENIRAHYDSELTASGWSIRAPARHGDRITACYRKPPFDAALTYSLARDAPYTFAFELTWGGSADC